MNGRAKPSHEHSRVLSRILLVMCVAQIYYVKSREGENLFRDLKL